jgi:hypothetical protein
MKKTVSIISSVILSFFIQSQVSDVYCPTIGGDTIQYKTASCDKTTQEYLTRYNRYNYYKDIYNVRNEVVIYVDVHVWQKDNGTENYSDAQTNRNRIQQTFDFLDYFYSNNEPPSDPISGIIDYSKTKIRFILNNIYFNESTTCWGKGGVPFQRDSDAIYLNTEADYLHPEGKKNIKWHLTGATPSDGAAGYAIFPQENLSTQHYVVSFNKQHDIVYPDNDGMWVYALHLAHEFGHNFDLYHTYANHCNQSDSDYLDDVFGSGTSAVCPHDFGFSCDFNSPNNSCTNNLGWNK